MGMILAAKKLLAQWVNVRDLKAAESAGTEGDVGGWSVDQITMFLDDLLLHFEAKAKEAKENADGNLKEAMAVLKAKEERLKKVYGFAQSRNVEVLFRMNLIALCVDD